jgi:uncharacterized protein (TIGR02996 family)
MAMSEDEAFIRAIVAAPRDDAPRLVYADWLDERGDKRGPYLRATVAWRRHLHDVGMREKTERQLRHAARLLDAEWMCRVTPPPIGVCCDRVHLHDRGTPIQPGRIHQLETRLRIRLPAEYRAFLLNYNGGTPEPGVYEIGFEGFSRVQAFFSLGERLTDSSGKASDDSLEAYAERVNAPIGRMDFFPVGVTVGSDGAQHGLEKEIERPHFSGSADCDTCLCIQLDNHRVVSACVVHFPSRPETRVPVLVQPIAESFPTLLSRLDDLPEGWEPSFW